MLLCVFLIAGVKIKRIYEGIVAFITPAEQGKASPLAQVVEIAGGNFAKQVVALGKAHLMGKASGEARAQAGVEADINEDLLAATNPAIGAILNQMPALRKTLRRNPALLDMALSVLAKKAGGQAAQGNLFSQPSPSNGHTQSLDIKIG